MPDLHRRHLLLSGALAAAFGALPPAIARALDIPAARRTGTIADVEHVVILTQENRAFDHYFGTLRGRARLFRPLSYPRAPRRDRLPATGRARRHAQDRAVPAQHRPALRPHARHRRAAHLDGCAKGLGPWPHERLDIRQAQPRPGLFHPRRHSVPVRPGRSLHPVRRLSLRHPGRGPTPTACSSGRAWSTPPANITARSSSTPTTSSIPTSMATGGYTWTTYPERLTAAGVTWQIYQNIADNFDDNPLVGFKLYRMADGAKDGPLAGLAQRSLRTRDLDLLKADVLADRLPQVSWVVAPAKDSEHPGPSSPAEGTDYTARVLDALTANPGVWAKTVLLINFDGERRLLRPRAAARPAVPCRRRHVRHQPDRYRRRIYRRTAVGPGAARAALRRVAVVEGRLRQFPGLRPHLGHPFPGDAVRRPRAQYQRLAPRRVRRPDKLFRFRRAGRSGLLPGPAADRRDRRPRPRP